MSKAGRSLRFASPEDMPAGMRALYEQQELAENRLRSAVVATVGVDVARDGMVTLVSATHQRGITTVQDVKHLRHPQRRPAGDMNKTEGRYAQQLDARKAAGEVVWWGFEQVKLRLARNTHLTIDFVVVLASGAIEAIDVKGRKGDRYWAEEDAKVKLKVAAPMFPWMRFAVVWPAKGGGWCREDFPA